MAVLLLATCGSARADLEADCAWFRSLGAEALAKTEAAYQSRYFERAPDSCGTRFAADAETRAIESPRVEYLWDALASSPILSPLQQGLAREVHPVVFVPPLKGEARYCARCRSLLEPWTASSSSTRLRMVVLSSKWLTERDDAVLAFVLAHEMGHLITGVSDTRLGQLAVDAAAMAIIESAGMELRPRALLMSQAGRVLGRSSRERGHSRAWYASRCSRAYAARAGVRTEAARPQ